MHVESNLRVHSSVSGVVAVFNESELTGTLCTYSARCPCVNWVGVTSVD